MRIEKLRSTFDIQLHWVHFPLHPETPAEGLLLEDLFAGRKFDMQAMKARLKQVAEAEGLPYGDRSHTYNSRLAQELAFWAETQEGGEGIHDALFKAYFVDAANVGQIDVLVAVAQALGLDGREARRVLKERRFQDAVDRDWARSRQMGVTGVPTFVSGSSGVVGAQPYEVLEGLVVEAGAQRRSA